MAEQREQSALGALGGTGGLQPPLTLPPPAHHHPLQVGKAPTQTRAARGSVAVRAAARANWLPGSDFPAHLENCKLPGCCE